MNLRKLYDAMRRMQRHRFLRKLATADVHLIMQIVDKHEPITPQDLQDLSGLGAERFKFAMEAARRSKLIWTVGGKIERVRETAKL